MKGQLEKYAARLLRDRSVAPGGCALAARDGLVAGEGEPALARLAADLLSRLPCAAVLAGRPSLPFADFLVRRAARGEGRIVPGDSESRAFLGDIPFLARTCGAQGLPARLAALLSCRSGAVAEGVGIVSTGADTVEQAYVHYSAVFHATFLKYLEELLREGFGVAGEAEALRAFRDAWPAPATGGALPFRPGPLADRGEILDELAAVGRYTVERGLVDSVFGNISCLAGGVIHISRTGASLDDLEGNVVAVPLAGSGPAESAASSELPIHRRIYETGAARAVLHAHPRFTVLLGMLCGETGCAVTDCATACDRVRFLPGNAPVVGGETGAAGAAGRIPGTAVSHGIAVVYGHGVFAVGRDGFAEPFRSMEQLEARCRREVFRRLGI